MIVTDSVKVVRQNSIDDEHKAMNDLDANTFMITAIDPLPPHQKYREYKLHEDLMICDQKYGSDHTLISDQSSIGNTPLKDVRFSQCNHALVTCAQEALNDHEVSSAGWPVYDPLERPVLRTNMLQRGIDKCLRVNSEDQMRVFTDADMTEVEFTVFGTVAMCNKRLIVCFENESGKYDDVVMEWDENHPA